LRLYTHTHTHTHTPSYLKTKNFYVKNKEQKLTVLLIVGADDPVCPQKITAVDVCSFCVEGACRGGFHARPMGKQEMLTDVFTPLLKGNVMRSMTGGIYLPNNKNKI
jgi:hypothetical protein